MILRPRMVTFVGQDGFDAEKKRRDTKSPLLARTVPLAPTFLFVGLSREPTSRAALGSRHFVWPQRKSG
jgi:hypothetical protein